MSPIQKIQTNSKKSQGQKMKVRKPTKEEIKEIRVIAKNNGIKGCKMSLRNVEVGRQTIRIETEVARAFVAELNQNGFCIDDYFVGEAIEKGIADIFSVYKNLETAYKAVEVTEEVDSVEVAECSKVIETSINVCTATMTHEGGNSHLKGEYKETSIDNQKEKAEILINDIDGTCTISCKPHVKVQGAGVKKKYDTFGDDNVYEVTKKKLELLEKEYVTMCNF